MKAKANVGTLKQLRKLWHTDLEQTALEATKDLERLTKTFHFIDFTHQLAKAAGMMRNFPLPDPFLLNHGVALNGKPFIEVTRWYREQDSLEFKFCYPIIKNDSLPSSRPLLRNP